MSLEYKATLQMLVPMIIQTIIEKKNITTIDAIKTFYTSIIYEKLEMEQTKLWHLSPLALYELWEMECNTGKVIFPEAA